MAKILQWQKNANKKEREIVAEGAKLDNKAATVSPIERTRRKFCLNLQVLDKW